MVVAVLMADLMPVVLVVEEEVMVQVLRFHLEVIMDCKTQEEVVDPTMVWVVQASSYFVIKLEQ